MNAQRFSRRTVAKAVATGTAASALSLSLAHAGTGRAPFYVNLAQDAGEITIYNWYETWTIEMMAAFTEETGIKVNQVGTYSANDEWWARLQAGDSFDFFMPTSDWVERAIKADLLLPLDLEQIPNVSTLEDDYQDVAEHQKDGDVYATPFVRLWYCLTFNTNEFSEAPTSWSVLWDDAYKGKITAQDNALARVGGTAIYLDDDPFSPTKWDEIRDALFEQKDLIQKYWKDYQAGMEMFINEEALVGQLTDGRTRMGAGLGGPMQWTVPEEGALVEVDTFAIPKVAENPEGAHQFIDFLYRPENQLKLMTDMGYDTVSAAAHEQLPEDLAEGFKAPDGAQGFVTRDLDPAVRTRMDELWTEVQLS